MARSLDFDWLVVGSGFGGSVSALRLVEKGYDVGVIESGKRFSDADFPRSTWDFRRYFFAPRLGLHGIFRLSTFKDVMVVSGAGVGGGSLGYANTLYRAPRRFYEDPQWAQLDTWESALEPHFDEAERMLGVTTAPGGDPADDLLKGFADHLGVSDTHAPTRVGVFLGEPGEQVSDPYFGGEGPDRTGCIACGRCMVGCPVGAKNTLVKNYLYLAERAGARVLPERTVVDIRPLGPSGDGSDGYKVITERTGGLLRKDRRAHTAQHVVVAAGALGTNKLLQRCRLMGGLPRISPRLGELVRTNSEAILAVTAPDDGVDYTQRVAISGSIYPDADTHIETVTYGHDGDSMSMLFTLMVGDGTRVTRPIKALATMARNPRALIRATRTKAWSRRTIVVLVMQTLDNAIALRPIRTRFGGMRLQTAQDPLKPNPTFIPVANDCAEWLADQIGGTPQSSLMETFASIPSTAHILGGAVIADGPERGVVDARQQVFGYANLWVCDGSVIPANVGVNPSLTITALAERAMSLVPAKDAAAAARPPAAARAA